MSQPSVTAALAAVLSAVTHGTRKPIRQTPPVLRTLFGNIVSSTRLLKPRNVFSSSAATDHHCGFGIFEHRKFGPSAGPWIYTSNSLNLNYYKKVYIGCMPGLPELFPFRELAPGLRSPATSGPRSRLQPNSITASYGLVWFPPSHRRPGLSPELFVSLPDYQVGR